MSSSQKILRVPRSSNMIRKGSLLNQNITVSTHRSASFVGKSQPSHTQRSSVLENSSAFPGKISHLEWSRPKYYESLKFDELLRSISTMLQTSSPPVAKLHSLLQQYSSDPSDWSEYALADPSKQYTRNLMCEIPGIFNLLLLVWTPGKASPVHDHADSHCIMKVLKGCLRERRYEIPKYPEKEGPLIQTSDLKFGLDRVSYISDKLGLHEISNPSLTNFAVSLHLYFPPNAALRGCNIFDIHNGKATLVEPSAYDSMHCVAL